MQKWRISRKEALFFVFSDHLSNNIYTMKQEKIKILMKNGEINDITDVSDQLKRNKSATTTNKYFLCYPSL